MRLSDTLTHSYRMGLLVGIVGFLVACGGAAQPPATTMPGANEATTSGATEQQTAAQFPVTIENCGIPFTYTQAPQRVLAMEGNMIEMMVKLGLVDRLVAYWTSGAELAPEVEAQLADATTITANWPGPSREVVLEQSPDFVFAGYGYGFSEESGLTQPSLLELQINSYAVNESCPNKTGRTTIEDTYTDIMNIGRVFGVPERAEQLVADMQAEVATVKNQLGTNHSPVRVFVYDDIGDDNPLTAGSAGLLNNLITLAGGINIFDDVEGSWATVGWESVIERDPDSIVVMDTDWESAEERIARLKSLPQLAALPAVANERFATIHYRQATPGLQNAEGVRQLAQGLHPETFQ